MPESEPSLHLRIAPAELRRRRAAGLEVLWIYDNRISGTMPTELMELTGLMWAGSHGADGADEAAGADGEWPEKRFRKSAIFHCGLFLLFFSRKGSALNVETSVFREGPCIFDFLRV